jgi:hypothetical protein
MQRMKKLLVTAAALLVSITTFAPAIAQNPLDSQPASSLPTFPDALPPFSRAAPDNANSPLYQDLDLLRRDGFAAANEATVTLRVVDKHGATPPDLHGADFALKVNGTPGPRGCIRQHRGPRRWRRWCCWSFRRTSRSYTTSR